MPALDTSPAATATAFGHNDFGDDRRDGDVLNPLAGLPLGVDLAAAVRADSRQVGPQLPVGEALRNRPVGPGAVALPGLAAGLLRVGLGRPLGEGSRLALAGPLQSLDRRLQQAEPAGQSGDQGVSLAEPGVEVGDQICDQRAQLSVLLTGIPGQHPGDSLVVIGGHRLPVVQHRARPVVDFRALRANSCRLQASRRPVETFSGRALGANQVRLASWPEHEPALRS